MILMKRKGYRIIFLITFLFSVCISSLLFMYTQVKALRKFLLDDFRIVVALSKGHNDSTIREICSINGVKNCHIVSSNELLKKLEVEDKILYLSIKSLSVNPVPDLVMIELYPDFLNDIDSISANVSKIKGVFDVRYKSDEVFAIVHAEFYIKFMLFVIGMVVLIVIVLIVFALIHFVISRNESFLDAFKWFSCGFVGGSFGLIFLYVVLYPMKNISLMWRWFEIYYSVGVVVLCGFIGWALWEWKRD